MDGRPSGRACASHSESGAYFSRNSIVVNERCIYHEGGVKMRDRDGRPAPYRESKAICDMGKLCSLVCFFEKFKTQYEIPSVLCK